MTATDTDIVGHGCRGEAELPLPLASSMLQMPNRAHLSRGIRHANGDVQDIIEGNEAMLGFYRHPAPLTSGARDTSDEHDRRCVLCRGAIQRGDGRYRIGDGEYHPDCFRSWLTAPTACEEAAGRH